MKLNALVYGITAAVVLVPGYFIVSDAVTSPEVGDCAEPHDLAGTEVEMTEVGCGSAEAVYRLVRQQSKGRPCPAGDFLDQRPRKTRYCYALDVAQGDCLQRTGWGFRHAACGAGATHRVAAVIAGGADPARCGGAAEVRSYSEPKTTICMEKA